MSKTVVTIGNFINTNWSAMNKAESSISRFKAKHSKFVAQMRAGDFESELRGATVKQLKDSFASWVDKTTNHIAENSGGIVASYQANKEAILDFQRDIKRAEMLKMSKGTEGMVSEKEMAALEVALTTYRNDCLPYIVKEAAAKLLLVTPKKADRVKIVEEQTKVIIDNEAKAVKELEEKEA